MEDYKKYLDEMGEPTYYVQNISNGHVVLSHLNLTIPSGKVKDLREDIDVETLSKSPDLRQALSPQSHLLKRLTKSEFDQLLKVQLRQEQNIKIQATNPEIADNEGNIKEAKVNITPKCQSMVEKLKLYYNKETKDKGITPEQFKIWLQNFIPTDDEKDYMMSVIGDKTIRTILIGMNTKEDFERERDRAVETQTKSETESINKPEQQ